MRKYINRLLIPALTISLAGFVGCTDDDGTSSGVIPTEADGTECSVRVNFDGPQTIQVLYPESDLDLHAGDQIVGLTFRLDDTILETFPTVNDGGFTDLKITIGQGPANNTLAQTFADNFVGDSEVLVYDNAKAFPANSFSIGSSPNVFGPMIDFSDVFTYQGGPLVVEIRSSATTDGLTKIDACTTGETSAKLVFADDIDATMAGEGGFPALPIGVALKLNVI